MPKGYLSRVTALRPLSIGHDGLVTEPSGIGGAQCYEWVVRLNLLVEQARQIVAVEATSNPDFSMVRSLTETALALVRVRIWARCERRRKLQPIPMVPQATPRDEDGIQRWTHWHHDAVKGPIPGGLARQNPRSCRYSFQC
jgi:hypothetical protein